MCVMYTNRRSSASFSFRSISLADRFFVGSTGERLMGGTTTLGIGSARITS